MDLPICAECRYEMEKKKTGLYLETGDHALHKGDLYRCPSCGIEVYLMNETRWKEGAFRDEAKVITDVEIVIRGDADYPKFILERVIESSIKR